MTEAVVDPTPGPDGAPIGAVARELYERVSPIQPDDERYDWALLKLVKAWSMPYELVAWIARDHPDGRSGWAHLFDPDTTLARFLPYLAARGGVRLRTGLSEAQQRATIKERPAAYVGTPGHLVSTARLHLSSPTARVRLDQRYGGDEDVARLVTYEAETPDPDAVARAVLARDVKPAGLTLIVEVHPGWSLGELLDAYEGQTLTALNADYATLADLVANLPAA